MRISLTYLLMPALSVALLIGGAGQAGAGATLDRILSEKTIRLGVRTDAPPFSSLVDGLPAGFSVDLCGLMAGAIMATSNLTNMTGTFVEVNSVDRLTKLEAGEIDVLCGATTATLKRRETMSFSIPVFTTGVGAMMSKTAPDLLKEIVVTGGPAALSNAAVTEAFKGRTVGVLAGTTAETWLKASALAKIDGLTIVTSADHTAGVGGVVAGTVDVYFADQAILIGLRAQSDKAESLVISKNTFTNEPYALALPRDDEDLRLMIDRALSYIYRTGGIYQVFSRHFGKPGPEVVLFYSVVSLPE